MDAATFRQCLLDDGYTEQFERELASDTLLDEHRHAWDSRLYVLRGTLEFTQGGHTRLLQVGDWCEVARDALHTERYGPQGCRVLIGRRMPEAGQGLLHPLGSGLTAMLTPGVTLLVLMLAFGGLRTG
ncbi:MAG: hypothetical protein RLY78_1820 [Pseudomonadota bacterium]|jgi:hypothetical protein|uniref:Cupin domain-containing protein n=1 Tax=Pseudaquabacterium rugosum TaxID=2984194 RepID=A0ABU9B5D3_9BURK